MAQGPRIDNRQCFHQAQRRRPVFIIIGEDGVLRITMLLLKSDGALVVATHYKVNPDAIPPDGFRLAFMQQL